MVMVPSAGTKFMERQPSSGCRDPAAPGRASRGPRLTLFSLQQRRCFFHSLTFPIQGIKPMRIGVLTSGGDCPGLNAVIRGAVLKGTKIHNQEFVGIRDGWKGVVEGLTMPLDRHSVRGLGKQGGTILGTSRTNPFEGPHGGPENVQATLDRLGIDALIAIGGEGTLAAAKRLTDAGLKIVGVPKTIDNDLDATDYSFGFDTAVEIATEAIDRLRTTGESHRRCM